MNKITGKNIDKKDVSAEILVNGIKEHNACTISNAFAKLYSEVGKVLANNIEKKGGIKDPMLNMKNRIENNCFLYPTTTQEIEKLIKNLKNKDSSGYNEISKKILKKIYPGIIKALEIIFNKSIEEGAFPSNMKLAIVKPLLLVISKILEKCVKIRIVNFCKNIKY